MDPLREVREAKDAKDAKVIAEGAYIDAKRKAIESHHPLKVGDRVTVNTYAHEGKTMEVTELFLQWSFGWLWIASGLVVKSDGTVGKNVARWCREVEA